MQDRYGLPLTTRSTRAAERFIEGLDLLLEQNFGPEAQFIEAIEADTGFALAYSALAYMLHLRAQVPEARERVHRRRRWLQGCPAESNNRLRPSRCSSMARAPAPTPSSASTWPSTRVIY